MYIIFMYIFIHVLILLNKDQLQYYLLFVESYDAEIFHMKLETTDLSPISREKVAESTE